MQLNRICTVACERNDQTMFSLITDPFTQKSDVFA